MTHSFFCAWKRKKNWLVMAALLLVLWGMTSCIGVNAVITMNSDNSGTIEVEYRFSRVLDSLGKLDGNEDLPPVPIGRDDIERTIARLPGMELLSYNSGADAIDSIITVKMKFADPETLLGFLDSSGKLAVYTNSNNVRKLTFTLNSGSQSGDSELDELLRQISVGYNVAISMNFPSEGQLSVVDAQGIGIHGSSGRKLTCSLPLETVLFAEDGIRAEFTWQGSVRQD